MNKILLVLVALVLSASALTLPNSIYKNSHITPQSNYAIYKEMREAKLKRLMADESFPLQLELHKLDCSSSHGKLDNYYFLKERLENPKIEIALPPPLVNGHDLIKLGIKPGPKMGKILDEISDMQLEGELTSKEEALEYIRTKLFPFF